MRQAKLYSASAARNAGAISDGFAVLCRTDARVLEIASGTGEHAARLCADHAGLRCRPSDPDEASRRSVDARAAEVPGGRMRRALALDMTEPGWWRAADGPYDALFCANMIHIAPPEATEGLFRGAGALLSEGGGEAGLSGAVLLYGPFSRRGAMAPSNHRFDASLKSRDPAWGVRDLDDFVQPAAARFGFALAQVREMPANNLMVRFEPN